jgi:glycogen debranching enzyme
MAAGHAGDVSGIDPDKMADELANDPRDFCRRLNNRPAGKIVVTWNWPNDVKRDVMIPPASCLLVRSQSPFRAELREGLNVLNRQDAILQKDGKYFALFMPRPPPADFLACTLRLSIYAPEGTQHAVGHVLFLPEPGKARVKRIFKRSELLNIDRIFLGTNGRGGMLRAAAKWGELRSKYDALLAGNLNPSHPEDRRVMLTRCRIWLVYQSYSQDVTIDRLEQFAVGGDHAHWQFRAPFGYGKMVYIEIEATMLPGLNAIRLGFKRLHALPHKHCLSDAENVRIIIFPDLEDRSFHDETKAFLGPEKSFPPAIKPQADGFVFVPDQSRRLRMTISKGEFHPEPKWRYMVSHPTEAERGLPASSDLFSPGYFQGELKGGDEVALAAAIITPEERERENVFLLRSTPIANLHAEENILDVLGNSLRQFIVRRDDHKTVIAGYPWFLDWGRDTLIFCRGMIAAGLTDDALSIIRQFASFEQDGTLPNMIIGDNASNRDCSDAPLWLFTACADLKQAVGGAFLNEKSGLPGASPGNPGQAHGERTLLEILRSIALSYHKGTANGIACDSESGLIFSPSHFTWMDTNHPAGTPREGYPIEIQALWFAALKFLAEISNEKQWDELAELVRDSIIKFYWNDKLKFFSDCLHAPKGTPAAKARADDALRPNQLLALTLGAVGNEKIFADTLSACAELLVPGAIRTLANQPVEYPLPVERNGRLINDPKNPYWGRYEGDEDSRRKPAYHNGTAWTWIFPSFCEAWFKHYGKEGQQTALAILNSSMRTINSGCVGQIPEILDGDYPHAQRGCDAQAWGVSELYRAWKLIATP